MAAAGAGITTWTASLAAAGTAGSSSTFTHGLGRRALHVQVADSSSGAPLGSSEVQVTQTTAAITVANLGSSTRAVRVTATLREDSSQQQAVAAGDARLSAGVGPAAVPAAPAQHALEQASGTVDGVNTAFSVSQAYVASAPFLVFWDGVLQSLYPGYTLTLSSPATGGFTQTAPPATVQRVAVLYWKA